MDIRPLLPDPLLPWSNENILVIFSGIAENFFCYNPEILVKKSIPVVEKLHFVQWDIFWATWYLQLVSLFENLKNFINKSFIFYHQNFLTFDITCKSHFWFLLCVVPTQRSHATSVCIVLSPQLNQTMDVNGKTLHCLSIHKRSPLPRIHNNFSSISNK